MAERRYYWLKLQRDFFKRHDIRIIEEMENGKDYLLFYLKLLVESIDHDGNLRFSDTIPYNEKMLSVVTNTNVDIVRAALKVFRELNLIEVLEDETLYMNEVEKMIGSETDWAKKKREYRLGLFQDTPRTKKDIVRQEKEKEIEIESDTPPLPPSGGETSEWNFDKHTNVENTKHFLNGGGYAEAKMLLENPELWTAVKDWMAYKDARKPRSSNHYVNEKSLVNFLNKVVRYARQCGVGTVVEVISDTIGSGYQGVVWDWCYKKRSSDDELEEWANDKK